MDIPEAHVYEGSGCPERPLSSYSEPDWHLCSLLYLLSLECMTLFYKYQPCLNTSCLALVATTNPPDAQGRPSHPGCGVWFAPPLWEGTEMWGWGLELPSLTLSFHKCVRPWMRLWVDTKMNKTQFQISRSFQCGTIDELCTHSYNTRKKEKSQGGGRGWESSLTIGWSWKASWSMCIWAEVED